ncbi:MAG TPA: O-antigen ligase family protein, partial [Patescibacteria group bacterium]|nr:O-antigen ligase family protein [Patescibacteria group bacterium]
HSAFVQLARNPMFGTGFGMHIPVESGAYRDFIEIRNIHNSWLVLLVQMGIVGFFTFIVFVSTLVWKVFALHPVTPFFSLLRSVSLTLILYQGIVFLAQPYLETNMLGIFFWMTLGMTNALIVIAHKAQYPSV